MLNAKDFLKGVWLNLYSSDKVSPDLLTKSPFLNDLDHITDCFDKYTKLPQCRPAVYLSYSCISSCKSNETYTQAVWIESIRSTSILLSMYVVVSLLFMPAFFVIVMRFLI